MRFRGSVAIDLGTVNTLVWVAGRGIVLEEPTAIAIDTGVGKVAAVGEAADALADKEPQDIQVIHPLRDGVIADLDATAASHPDKRVHCAEIDRHATPEAHADLLCPTSRLSLLLRQCRPAPPRDVR